jgi:hypothetical protein
VILILQYSKIIWTARLITLSSPILAVIFSLLIVLLATLKPDSFPSGVFQGGTIMLFPFALAIALIAWKWSLVGGILVLLFFIPFIFPMLSASGWPIWYKVSYLIFWVIFIAGGILHIFSYFLRKTQVI